MMFSYKNFDVSLESKGFMILYSSHFVHKSMATSNVVPPLGAGGSNLVMQSMHHVLKEYNPLQVGYRYGGTLKELCSI